MSRWLWAGSGVSYSSRSLRSSGWPATRRMSPSRFRPTPVAPAPASTPPPRRTSRPRLRPVPSAPAAHVSRSAPTPPAPALAPDAGQQAASPRSTAPSAVTPSAPPVVAQEPPPPPAPAPPAEATPAAPAPGREARRKSRAYMRPRASRSWSGPGPIPRRIVSGSSSGAAAAGPIGSRWTSSPRPRLSSCRRKSFSLPPSAGSTAHPKWKASLKVSADCEDSISFTPRSVMIALRSATELIYSASGDPALATTLKKCAP